MSQRGETFSRIPRGRRVLAIFVVVIMSRDTKFLVPCSSGSLAIKSNWNINETICIVVMLVVYIQRKNYLKEKRLSVFRTSVMLTLLQGGTSSGTSIWRESTKFVKVCHFVQKLCGDTIAHRRCHKLSQLFVLKKGELVKIA